MPLSANSVVQRISDYYGLAFSEWLLLSLSGALV